MEIRSAVDLLHAGLKTENVVRSSQGPDRAIKARSVTCGNAHVIGKIRIPCVSPLHQNKNSRMQTADEKPGSFQVPLFRQPCGER